MKLQGRRIHIVGSADLEADERKLVYVHELVSRLTTALVANGAIFVIPFGKEPYLKNRVDGPSIIFDWTVAAAVHSALTKALVQASSPNGRLVATIATTKTNGQIPAARRPLFEEMQKLDAISMEALEPGWSAGAILRPRLAQLGDILIGVSGGQGVEQLAIEYSSKGKPVIPLDINVGAFSRDGSGGASRLFDRALAEPTKFFKVADCFSATDLLDRTRTHNAETDVSTVVDAIVKLLHALVPPQVFYVRLLNDKIPEYASVEEFFRNSVDPLVRELGYEPLQMGIGKNEFAWMNQAIFDSLHHCSVALVDLTSLRSNCFMELGYALGHQQRVIVTARDDTRISFDAFALEAFQWNQSENVLKRLDRFRIHWARNINMPTLVRPKEAK